MTGFFAGKTVVLGVTGSIAAYKACEIASRLTERGACVITALTASAQRLVGAASLEAITGQRAVTAMFEPVPQPEIEHIAVAQRANLFLIAPATANVLAKAAHGLADDWLSTSLLATRAPILFAPAMNTLMYEHAATQANIECLRRRGCYFVGPGTGKLACGDVGLGRLIDVPAILEAAAVLLHPVKDLAGKHVLITMGGNHEAIDPVRYIGNRSSGKMGYALALEALARGARVTVVCGPCEAPPPCGAHVTPVTSAAEMFEAVQAQWKHADVFVGAAAVADYRVDEPAQEKRKRGSEPIQITLTPNPDIAAWVGQQKRPGQCSVCFAAETHAALENAEQKRLKKNADLMLVNQVGGEHCAFGSKSAMAAILPSPTPELVSLEKEVLAAHLFDRVAALLG